MAPGARGRGRPRKIPRGGSRMDAAVDAMKPYGFSDDMIVETMKELLNVYTDEGWALIEDSSYDVLREALLEKFAEDSKKMDDESVEHGSGSGSNTIAAGPSNEAPVPSLSIMVIDAGSGSIAIAAGPSSEAPVPTLSIMEIDSGSSNNTIAALPSTSSEIPVPTLPIMEIGTGSVSNTIAAGQSTSGEAPVPTPSNMEIDTSESQVTETVSELQVTETVDTLTQTESVPDPSHKEISAVESQVTETIETSSQTYNVPGESKCNSPSNMEIDTSESQVVETVSELQVTETVALTQTESVPDPSHKEISAVESQVTETIETSSLTYNVPGETNCSSSPRFINFPERLDTLPTQKRRPYHGWVSRNNNEKPDLVYLTPAPLPEALQVLFRMNRQRRWDVKPIDVESV